MDPRLRVAVDTSLAWYDEVFAPHAIPTRAEHGLWWSLAKPPRWHSAAKTLEPGVDAERVVAALDDLPGASGDGVADSFGDLGLGPFGFRLLFEAQWLHHAGGEEPPARLPDGWSVVREAGLLSEWTAAHDYADVLLPRMVDLPSFTLLARHEGAALTGGAVLHRRWGARDPDVVGLSNTWSRDPGDLDHAELLAAVGALAPGCAVTGYASGDELAAMLDAGWSALGPQRVWLR